MDASAKTSESKLKRWRHQSKEVLKVMSVTPKVLKLIWNANKKLTFGVFFLSSLSAVVPVIELELTRALLDTMTKHIGTSQNLSAQIFLLIAGMALTGLIFTCIEPTRHYFQENLGDILTRDINALILRKASSFQDLAPFENPEFYDKLTKAEDEAGYKPLLTLTHVAGLFYAAVGLGSFLVVLVFSATSCFNHRCYCASEHYRSMQSISSELGDKQIRNPGSARDALRSHRVNARF